MHTQATPKSAGRIELLDIARGLAVFGILLVNIAFYSSSLQEIQWQMLATPRWWNTATQTIIDIFVSGKFLSIFSFLFGYGMIIFKDRAEKRGRRFVPLFSRRLALLMLIGILHGWFIWFGDILFHYAVLGFVLMLFHKRKSRTMLIWAVVLLSLLPALVLLGGGSAGNAMLDPEFEASIQEWIAADHRVYSSGSYGEIQLHRMTDWSASAFNQIVFYPQILGLFLLGAYFARRGIFHDPVSNRQTIKRFALWTGPGGLIVAAGPSLLNILGESAPDAVAPLSDLSAVLGGPLLGLFYIAALALLLDKALWQKILKPFAAVGRMALSHYIGQSIVGTLIFYGYGLGIYGKTGPLANVLLAIGIFTLQLGISAAWFKRYRMGPLEWLWRIGTYGSVSSLRYSSR